MNKTFFLYAVSALAILALADFYPKLSMFFVGLLILGVITVHGSDYADLLNKAQGQKGGSLGGQLG